jgi:hypothetical protein
MYTLSGFYLIAPVSSVADGEDTTRPCRQGRNTLGIKHHYRHYFLTLTLEHPGLSSYISAYLDHTLFANLKTLDLKSYLKT